MPDLLHLYVWLSEQADDCGYPSPLSSSLPLWAIKETAKEQAME